jgi:hypothetical protein
MKKLLLTVITIASLFPAKGQDWRLIQYEKVPLFSGYYQANIVAAIQLDSVTVSNGDSLMWNYRVENPNCDCYTSVWNYYDGRCTFQDTGWLGLPTIESQNIYKFINYENDTLTLKPGAQLNDTWVFSKADNNRYVEARVDGIYADTVLGMTDSLKRITLTLMSQNGTPVSNGWFTNYKIVCSKNNGMVEGFYLYFFDADHGNFSDCPRITLAGFQNGAGRKLPTNETIYDFQVGDKFHYSCYHFHPNLVHEFGPTPDETYRIKRTIVGINSSATELKYTILDSVEYFAIINFNYQTGAGTLQTNYYQYTDTIKKPKNAGYILPDTAPLDSLFWSNGPNTITTLRINSGRYNGTIAPNIGTDIRAMEDTPIFLDTSLNYYGCFFEGGPFRTFVEANGLGAVVSAIGHSSIMGADGISEQLVYYKKGNVSSGNPIKFTGINDVSIQSGIKIFPNPTSKQLTVQTPENSDFDVTIANVQGIKLGTYRFKDTSLFTLDVSSLTAGIYLLTVRDRNGLRKTLKFQKL